MDIEDDFSSLISEISSSQIGFQRSGQVSTWEVPGHLNHPITTEDVEFLLENEQFYCKRHKSIKATLSNQRNIYECCPSPWSCLEARLMLRAKNLPDVKPLLSTIISSAVTSMLSQKGVYMKMASCDQMKEREYLLNKLTTTLRHIHRSDPLSKLYSLFRVKKYVEGLKNTLSKAAHHPGTFLTLEDSSISVEKEVTKFDCSEHGHTLLPTALFIGCLDNLQCRFPLYLYWYLCDLYGKYPHIPEGMFGRGGTMVRTLLVQRKLLGESFFSLIKLHEPYVVGQIVRDTNNDLGNTSLFEVSERGIREISTSFPLEIWAVRNSTTEELSYCLEMIGISKIFGHPALNPIDGMKKVQECTRRPVPVDPDISWSTRNLFVYTFIKSYVIKKRTWPRVNFFRGVHTLILKAYTEHRWLSQQEEHKVTLSEWGHVEMEKTYEFDCSVDVVDLLKDTAIAPPLQYWFSHYDHCAFKILHNQSKPRLTERPETRTMLCYLKAEEGLTKKLVDAHREGRENWKDFFAILSPKERELKAEGRLFCKQPFPQRMYQVSLENNIKKNVLPFIRHITMADSELKLGQKQGSLVKTLYTKENVEVVVLDIKNWNMWIRWEFIRGIAWEIDKIFGESCLYSNNHYWFHKSVIVHNSRLKPPRIGANGLPEPGDFCHYGQLGGMEGMRQKLWTIATVMLILLSARLEGVVVSLLGQGDNQVVLIKWSDFQMESRDEHRRRFLERLNTTFNSVGLTLKLSETFYSSRYFEYGKVRYINGVAVSRGTKIMARCITDINDGLATFASSMATLSTCTENTARSDFRPEPAFLINQIEVLNYLSRHKIINETTPNTTLVALLHFPNALGGLNLSAYPFHCIRGIDDRLTCWLSLIKGLKRFVPTAVDKLLCLVRLDLRSKFPMERLISDIFCLPILGLPSAESQIRDIVKSTICSYATNPDVIRLFSQTTIDKDQITGHLSEMDPFLAPMAHELLRCSNIGLLESLQGQFCKVQSLVRLAKDGVELSNGGDIVETLKSSEWNFTENLKKRLLRTSVDKLFLQALKEDCSMVGAQYLRTKMYNKNIIGSTHPVPWEQIRIASSIAGRSRPDSIWVQCNSLVRAGGPDVKWNAGLEDVFLGSMTSPKTVKGPLETLHKSTLAAATRSLQIIYSWALRIDSEGLAEFCLALLKEKSHYLESIPDPFMDLESMSRNYGGHIMHRFRSVIERQGCLINFLPTLTTHINISTSKLEFVTKGGADYTIYFQLLFIYIISYIIHRALSNIPSPLYYYGVFECNFCTYKLADVSLNFPALHEDIPKLLLPKPWSLPPPSDLGRYSLENLRETLSIVYGGKYAYQSAAYQTSVYDERFLTEEEVRPESHQSISIAEFRGCDLSWVLTGLLVYDSELRKCVMNYLYNRTMSMHITKKFQSLAANVIVTSRQEELCALLDVVSIEHSQTLMSSKLSDLIARSLPPYFSSNISVHCMRVISVLHDSLIPPSIQRSCLKWVIDAMMWVLISRQESNDSQKNYLKYLRALHLTNITSFLNLVQSTMVNFFGWTSREYLPLNLEESQIILAWRDKLKHIGSELQTHRAMRISPFIDQPLIISDFPSDSPCLVIPANTQSFSNKTGMIHLAYHMDELKSIHHVGRPIGKISSSASKYLSILCALKNVIPSFESPINIFCLAEGSGGTAFMLSHIYKRSTVFFDSLTTPEIDPRQEICDLSPPAFHSHSKTCEGHGVLDLSLTEGDADLLSPIMLQKLIETTLRSTPSIVTMDAESMTKTGNLEHLSWLHNLANVIRGQTVSCLMIIKIFGLSAADIYESQFMAQGFEVITMKPINSCPFSEELFSVVSINGTLKPHNLMTASLEPIHSLPSLERYVSDLSHLGNYLMRYCSSLPCLDLLSAFEAYNGTLFTDDIWGEESITTIGYILMNQSWERGGEVDSKTLGRARGHRLKYDEAGRLISLAIVITNLRGIRDVEERVMKLLNVLQQMRESAMLIDFPKIDKDEKLFTSIKLTFTNDPIIIGKKKPMYHYIAPFSKYLFRSINRPPLSKRTRTHYIPKKFKSMTRLFVSCLLEELKNF